MSSENIPAMERIDNAVLIFMEKITEHFNKGDDSFNSLPPMDQFLVVKELFKTMDSEVEWACVAEKDRAIELHNIYLNS